MENKHREYPSVALILEVLGGFLIGVMGLGHIYNGSFFSGAVVLLSYWLLLATEVIVFLLILTEKVWIMSTFLFLGMSPLLIFLFFIHNMLFALVSASMIRLNLSKKFAKILISLVSFVSSLTSFVYFIRSDQWMEAIAVTLFIIISSLLIKIFIDSDDEVRSSITGKAPSTKEASASKVDITLKEYTENAIKPDKKIFNKFWVVGNILILLIILYLIFGLIKKANNGTNHVYVLVLLGVIVIGGILLTVNLMNLFTRKK